MSGDGTLGSKLGEPGVQKERGVRVRVSKIPSPAARTGTGPGDTCLWIWNLSLSFNVRPSESGRNAGLAMNGRRGRRGGGGGGGGVLLADVLRLLAHVAQLK